MPEVSSLNSYISVRSQFQATMSVWGMTHDVIVCGALVDTTVVVSALVMLFVITEVDAGSIRTSVVVTAKSWCQN